MTVSSARAALTVKGLQNYLSLSRSTIYRMVDAGQITPVKVGGRTLFRRIDADMLLGLVDRQPPRPVSIFD